MYKHSTYLALLGLDIGKNINVFAAYRPNKTLSPIIKPVTVRTNRAGFEIFAGHLDRLLNEYEVVRLGDEPTGIYYEAWGREILHRYADEIAAGRLDYRLILPTLTKASRLALMRGRFRKTDAIDTAAIARCLMLEEGTPASFATGHALRFNLWAHHYRRLERERARLTRIILLQADRLWPGAFVNVYRFKKTHPDMAPPVPLVQTRPLKRKLVRALFTHCPNPHDVLAFTEAEMLEFLREHIGRAGLKNAQKVLRNARQALLPPPDVAESLAHYLSIDWQRYLLLDAQLQALDDEAERLVPDSPAAVLTTMPGVGILDAARYLAYLRDPDAFSSAAQVWAFAGFDPITNSSGDVARIGKISKRGAPGFRAALYSIGRHTSQYCPPVRQTFQHARARFRADGNIVRATIHAAGKANRILFRMLRDQTPYSFPN